MGGGIVVNWATARCTFGSWKNVVIATNLRSWVINTWTTTIGVRAIYLSVNVRPAADLAGSVIAGRTTAAVTWWSCQQFTIAAHFRTGMVVLRSTAWCSIRFPENVAIAADVISGVIGSRPTAGTSSGLGINIVVTAQLGIWIIVFRSTARGAWRLWKDFSSTTNWLTCAEWMTIVRWTVVHTPLSAAPRTWCYWRKTVSTTCKVGWIKVSGPTARCSWRSR